MKLVVAIVQAEDAGKLIRALLHADYRATRINTAGGFLREGNATILIGVEAADVDAVLGLVERHCQSRTRTVMPPVPLVGSPEIPLNLPVEVPVGGATVFVLDVERFERL